MSLALFLSWVFFFVILAVIAWLLWRAVGKLPAGTPAWVASLCYVLILVACAIAVAVRAGILRG
jgi:hypothetical protein